MAGVGGYERKVLGDPVRGDPERSSWSSGGEELAAKSLCSHYAVMKTRTLTLRGVPDTVLKRLRVRAEANHRSLNGELLTILSHAVREEGVTPRPAVVRETVAPIPDLTRPPLHESVDPAELALVCRRHHIRWLGLFGSHAAGNPRPDSDVDLVVDFEPGMTPGFAIVTVAADLQQVFGGRRVDLVTRRGLSPRLREEVMEGARTLYVA